MDQIPPPRGVGPSAPRQGPTDRRVVEQVRRFRPGDAVVRVTRPKFTGFARRGAGRIEASLTLEEPRGAWGKLWRVIVGAPIHSEVEINERLTKKKAVAVFSADALSSVAYAPQETLVVLLAAGTAAIFWSLPISIAVVLLLAAVVFSYRQTIYAYPSGGGSYIVAHENLGEIPGLVAAAALSVGYILTVSVSIASAIDQMVSALPSLLPFKVELGIAAVALVTLANLRGVGHIIPRESESVISLLAHAVFGGGPLYYLVQFSAVFILILAANTAYADFPRLASLLARDAYAPKQLAFRGERLAFSNGIIMLGLLSALLIVVFAGSTGALLPLYAVAVFAAFTLSQAGMVRHWRGERG